MFVFFLFGGGAERSRALTSDVSLSVVSPATACRVEVLGRVRSWLLLTLTPADLIIDAYTHAHTTETRTTQSFKKSFKTKFPLRVFPPFPSSNCHVNL